MLLADALGAVPLFAALPDDLRRSLADAGERRAYTAGALVCAEGATATSMFVVLAGTLRVTKGADVEVASLGPGEIFGEFALFDGLPRSASVHTDTDADVFVLERDAFLELLASAHSGAVFQAVLAVLVERVRRTSDRVLDEEIRRRTAEAEMLAERHRVAAEMLAGLAHEINTPLGVARTGASILEARLEEPEVRAAVAGHLEASEAVDDMVEASQLIQRSLARAHHLVETLKRTSVDHFAEQVEDLDLPEVIAGVLEVFRLHSRQSRLVVAVDDRLAPGERRWRGDPGQLTQVLTNLLFNAERHAYPEGVGGVEVGLARAGDDFSITVTDQGRGIPAEHLREIFRPFFTTARERGGTGLGLAIVRNLITNGLRGRVEVESAVGAGTTFRLLIPAA
ncbi:MAG: cyclic nucleotide-binding domain-containing protein [Myxococcales bacterium]|nr:cyclic nucleotide-binding domain-containing protein [Myxococcales bacterium]